MVVYIFRTGPKNRPDWTEGIKFGPDQTRFLIVHMRYNMIKYFVQHVYVQMDDVGHSVI